MTISQLGSLTRAIFRLANRTSAQFSKNRLSLEKKKRDRERKKKTITTTRDHKCFHASTIFPNRIYPF